MPLIVSAPPQGLYSQLEGAVEVQEQTLFRSSNKACRQSDRRPIAHGFFLAREGDVSIAQLLRQHRRAKKFGLNAISTASP